MPRGVAASFASCSLPILGVDPVSVYFDITVYRIEGSTLLTNNQVQSAVAPFPGKASPAYLELPVRSRPRAATPSA